ncbi:uncharacterized protein SPSK_04727 [Sporothrix schenckii 1099-18]|uniref:Uncharacterized protein n=1 Tax=Sporothrix schenckii 1099-18 TaxID=1397361 RepID=A0A0F2M047_SPOSC|nr:uncharacterized protein SPSK_04727 [Sporothrix schenckii 1099-18]KJR83088.1 hypothetical protein SPSK_04727 [Sporothrix schenckii 1099-18]
MSGAARESKTIRDDEIQKYAICGLRGGAENSWSGREGRSWVGESVEKARNSGCERRSETGDCENPGSVAQYTASNPAGREGGRCEVQNRG